MNKPGAGLGTPSLAMHGLVGTSFHDLHEGDAVTFEAVVPLAGTVICLSCVAQCMIRPSFMVPSPLAPFLDASRREDF